MKNLIFIVLVLFISCQNKKLKTNIIEQEAIGMKFEASSNKENLKNYIHDIKIIKLKTEINLVNINKVVFFENRFYILDKKTSQLIIFDENGEFIQKIGERGTGPGEYRDIRDFQIDKSNRQILFISNKDYALFKFSLVGEFIEKLVFDFYVEGFVITNLGNYVFMSSYESEHLHSLTKTDPTGKLIDRYFPFPKDVPKMGFRYTGGLHKQGRTNYFSRYTSSIIYKIGDSVWPVNKLEAKNIWKEENVFKLNEFLKGYSVPDTEYTVLYNFFCDTDEILAFNFRQGKYKRMGYYFKNHDKIISVPHNLKHNYLSKLIKLPVGIKGDDFISTVNYELFDGLMSIKNEGLIFKEEYPELLDKFENFKENDNPYLLIYKLEMPI